MRWGILARVSPMSSQLDYYTFMGFNPEELRLRYATYADKDFRLGLNAAQTTLAAIAQLAGAALKR